MKDKICALRRTKYVLYEGQNNYVLYEGQNMCSTKDKIWLYEGQNMALRRTKYGSMKDKIWLHVSLLAIMPSK